MTLEWKPGAKVVVEADPRNVDRNCRHTIGMEGTLIERKGLRKWGTCKGQPEWRVLLRNGEKVYAVQSALRLIPGDSEEKGSWEVIEKSTGWVRPQEVVAGAS